ncbi:MAG: single-stranded-DNA-specific exonuclease RecJ [Betaproteobacteria bacterium SG8_39]|nr:MAG: single-stranded-DNA-specific exonuclease RecJ [Betaproteobacteria bacterium SG8_39]
MQFVERKFAEADRQALLRAGLHPVLARVYAGRQVHSPDELSTDATKLVEPAALANVERAAAMLADAIGAKQRILIVADYDADGATACAVGLRALRSFGAKVDYLVPDRFKLGYGLSPELVDLAAERQPDLLVTVDNGIASVDGVARANALGIATLITDHHLPGDALPAATCIVNPNQPGCDFPSKSLAGVGVMFYVMLALRAELRKRDAFSDRPQPNLGMLTDLVALGTVADVVPLDANNRVLVAQGLNRIRAGRAAPGLNALLRIAGRSPAKVSAFDLGFVLGPRLNAAGRLADMGLGIECLVTDDEARAANCAQALDALNRERRKIESDMLDTALGTLETVREASGAAAVFFEPGWHQGVVGILAARLRERLHRPVLCFARADSGAEDGTNAGLLRGSGRSIPGFHLRDCLDLVAKRAPGMILRFGGHAQAAGLTLREADLDRFSRLFERTAAERMPPGALSPVVETDGILDSAYLSLEVAQLIERQIWGQGFPQPVFCDTFVVENQRIVGERHLKLKLMKDGRRYEAIRFGSLDPLPSRARAAYRLSVNEFNGLQNVQLTIEHVER